MSSGKDATSQWPIMVVLAVFFIAFGLVLALNNVVMSGWVLLISATAILLYTLYGWFADILSDMHNTNLTDYRFHHATAWFLVTQAVFFTTMIICLLYYRNVVIDWFNGEGYFGSTFHFLYRDLYHSKDILLGTREALLWGENNGHRNVGGPFSRINAFGIPLAKTCVLLISMVTIAQAYRAIKNNYRVKCVNLFGASIVLGMIFVCLQAYEYGFAYAALNLTLGSGIYGSTFYLLTGVYGAHVLIGLVIAIFVWGRCVMGQINSNHQVMYQVVAGYWYFLVVVWICLYLFVYF